MEQVASTPALATACGDKLVRIWDLSNISVRATLSGHTNTAF
jgi:hypothetical protein